MADEESVEHVALGSDFDGIERGPDLTARLVCVKYAPEVYDADEGPLPPQPGGNESVGSRILTSAARYASFERGCSR